VKKIEKLKKLRKINKEKLRMYEKLRETGKIEN